MIVINRRFAIIFSSLLAGCVSLADPLGAPPDAFHAWSVHDDNRPPVKKVAAEDGRPPSDAKVLFDGTAASIAANWCDREGRPTKWTLDENGELISVKGAGYIFTKDGYSDFQLHVEWASPTNSTADVLEQERGNSGVFLMGSYEIQILDSHMTDPDAPGGNPNPNYADGLAGAAYGQNPPAVNPCRAPGVFNSYDIVFHAPKEEADGVCIRPATVTVFFNGVVVQDHWLFDGPTEWRNRATYERSTSDTGLKRTAKMPIALQDHGDPVRFRNVWIRELASPEDNVTHGRFYANAAEVTRLRAKTAKRLDCEFEAKWGGETNLARKLVESWRVVGYAASADRTARVCNLEREYLDRLRVAKTLADADNVGIPCWEMKMYYENLAKSGLVLPGNPVLVRLGELLESKRRGR